MLGDFFEPGDWFPPKRYGYGAGPPIAWQGWALTISYTLLVIGTAFGIANADPVIQASGGALVLFATVLFVCIARARTRGGWRWRWGEQD